MDELAGRVAERNRILALIDKEIKSQKVLAEETNMEFHRGAWKRLEALKKSISEAK